MPYIDRSENYLRKSRDLLTELSAQPDPHFYFPLLRFAVYLTSALVYAVLAVAYVIREK